MKRSSTPHILIVGCGDVGRALAIRLMPRFRVFGTARSDASLAAITKLGATAIKLDLDYGGTRALGAIAPWVVHLAPPSQQGLSDLRTRHLLPQLGAASRIVYASTSGVYGDCAGALIDETRRVAPNTPRARRRLDAEEKLREHALRTHQRLSIVRVPGIYSAKRLPRERLLNGTPAARAEEDVFTNHIHVDDLAQILEAALLHGRSQRIYHACDDTQLLMGDYFDLVADRLQLPRPPRLARAELLNRLTVAQASFMLESRRLANRRIKEELGVRLTYPTVEHQLKCLTADSLQLPG